MNQIIKKSIIIGFVVALIGAYFYFNLGNFLTLEYFNSQKESIQNFYQEKPIFVTLIYLGIYILTAALSLPGAAVLTIAGGAIFGLNVGTLAVSFASTIGATLAFFAARYVMRDSVQRKFGDRLAAINEGIKKEGAFYLFTLRLVPIFPFFLINLIMGLTPLSARKFFFVSQIGMLPGTVVYVNAGTQLGLIKFNSLSDFLTPSLILSFALLGIFPLLSKRILDSIKTKKIYRKFKKPKKFDYNIIAIGAGSAGLVTSYIAAAVKSKVALIEKHKMGGDCLNTGCVPSKALIKSAKILHQTKNIQKYGFQSAEVQFDFAQVMDRVQNVVDKVAPHDSIERYTDIGVECLQGEAKILDPWRIEINGKTLTTKNIVVATGAHPFVPPFEGLDQIDYHTSDTVWNLRIQPKKLLVLGGGPIGSELTQAFARLGSHVTQVEMGDRLMSREDPEISKFVQKKFESEGIRVLTRHKATRFGKNGENKYLTCQNLDINKEVKIEFDEVLIALGRRANVTGFGLENLGIEISKRGTIEHNEFLQTKYPNIYVCGDVAGPYQFTHTSAHQAWFASVNALFGRFKKFKVDYRVIPWATFTDPEVARVGLNETEAKEKGIEYEVTTFGIDDLDRAIADGDDFGIIKVLTPPGKDKILGVTFLGEHAGDLIIEFISAMKNGQGLNKILGTIHIYPTLSESNKYLAGNWKKAHQPKKALEWIKKLHAWERGQ